MKLILGSSSKYRKEILEKAGYIKVFFKPFSDSFIEDFIKKGEPLKLAGGFGVLHPIMKPHVDKIEGTEESIAGMPLHLLKKLLTQAGY
ncbi:MAG: Maf family protein [bacterium]